jgi:hypothetical protein
MPKVRPTTKQKRVQYLEFPQRLLPRMGCATKQSYVGNLYQIVNLGTLQVKIQSSIWKFHRDYQVAICNKTKNDSSRTRGFTKLRYVTKRKSSPVSEPHQRPDLRRVAETKGHVITISSLGQGRMTTKVFQIPAKSLTSFSSC